MLPSRRNKAQPGAMVLHTPKTRTLFYFTLLFRNTLSAGLWNARYRHHGEHGNSASIPTCSKSARNWLRFFFTVETSEFIHSGWWGRGAISKSCANTSTAMEWTRSTGKPPPSGASRSQRCFRSNARRKCTCAIDFSRLTAQEFNGQSVLERFLTAALVLGLVAQQQQGDLFGLLTFSDRSTGFCGHAEAKLITPPAATRFTRCNPTSLPPIFNDLCSYIRLRLRRRALLVMLTDLSDPVLAESFVQDTQLISRNILCWST